MGLESPPPLPPRLATITVLKGMIGTGVLGLPYVCGQVRLAVAAPGLLATAAVGAFSVWRLIQCKALLAAKRLALGAGGDADDDEEDTFGLGPLATVGRAGFGSAGVAVAGFGIIASQLGFAVSYVDVIVETLSEPTLLGSRLSIAALRFFICALLCALCLLRRLSSLAWLSGAALLIYAYLLAALIFYGGGHLADGSAPDMSQAFLPIRWRHFGSWFGTAIFAQEAIVISQYVYDDMQLTNPRRFLPVLISSFGISGALFTFVGVFGFLSYGDAVENVFYLNFPAGSIAVSLGEVVLCLVLLLSFALQMYPVMSFLEAVFLGIGSRAQESTYDNPELDEDSDSKSSGSDSAGLLNPASGGRGVGLASSLLRCAAVVLTCAAAALVPNLACVTGYSGCFAMSSIGFFLPPLCHTRLCGGKLSLLEIAGNAMLLLAGCAAVFFGVATTSCG